MLRTSWSTLNIQRLNGHSNKTLYEQTYNFTNNRDHLQDAQPVLADIPGQVLTIPAGETGRVILPPVTPHPVPGVTHVSDRSSALIRLDSFEKPQFLRIYIRNNRLVIKFNNPHNLLDSITSYNHTYINVRDQYGEQWPAEEDR